jgi:serine/threonine protein kinase
VLQAILSNEIDWDAPELQPLSAAARDFLERLLQRNPVLRPSAAEALEHPWLAVEGAANDMPLKVNVGLADVAGFNCCHVFSMLVVGPPVLSYLLLFHTVHPWLAVEDVANNTPLKARRVCPVHIIAVAAGLVL